MLLAIALLATLVFAVYADTDDDTLCCYLNKSELIVVGKISKIIVTVVDDAGAPEYVCNFQIDDVIKVHPLQTNSMIWVNIKRFETQDGDKHPLVAVGKQSILFLKHTYDEKAWDTVDYWFGIQPPFPALIRSLKRLEKGTVEQSAPPYGAQGAAGDRCRSTNEE